MGVMLDEREDRFDEFLRQAAQDYNPPPETPKAAMWEKVRAERGTQGRQDATTQSGMVGVLPFPRPIARPAVRPALKVALGIAALLALGVAIGRFTAPSPSGTATPASSGTIAVAPERRDRRDVAGEVATGEHLSQVETFLTDFGSRPASPEFSAEARELLGTTRLLLDSKRVPDPRTRKLLEDLELILTQITALDPKDRREDLDFITDGLAQSHLRTRLRNAIPGGPAIRM
jgi:hypothetical protein